MKRVLLTWSDRGISGPSPKHHGKRPHTDEGPINRFMENLREDISYQQAIVLVTPQSVGPALCLVNDLKRFIPEVETLLIPLLDPTNHDELFRALEPVVLRFGEYKTLDIILSAGTPQMQTLWIVLVKAGLLKARMLQVIPSHFVPSVHDFAIREVHLDVEGFPEIRSLRHELVRLRSWKAIGEHHLIGESQALNNVIQQIGRVAASNLPILVQGETGTGKELVARAIHKSSYRASAPLVVENCGALTESVLASELFGHEKGAFTGALVSKKGLFELADGGTLFLDEVGEMSPLLQVNLLRVLQDGTLRRLGSEKTIQVDVRIIAATHRDLLALVRAGTFREDLYYRLQGASLLVPPLRERSEDIEPLVSYFLREVQRELCVTKEAWKVLYEYDWPGNVRELRSEVMRWQVFCDSIVQAEDLNVSIAGTTNKKKKRLDPTAPNIHTLAHVVEEAERDCIELGLARVGGNLSQCARLLEIDRNTLKRKLKKYNIVRGSVRAGRPAAQW